MPIRAVVIETEDSINSIIRRKNNHPNLEAPMRLESFPANVFHFSNFLFSYYVFASSIFEERIFSAMC